MTEQPASQTTTGDFEFAALREAREYRKALLHDFSPFLQGRVLEVGAGIGQLTEELLQLDDIKQLTSVEPDPSFCALLRKHLPQLCLVEGTAAELPPNTEWDAILSVNVLEHIEHDAKELAMYRSILQRTQGTLCLFVPARQEIYAPIDRDFGHFRRYNRSDLLTKLRSAGFQPIQLRYYNFVGYFLWWINFCMLKQRTFNPAMVRLFDRAAFPLIHAFESRVAHPPIGQSLLVIARV